MKDLTYIFPLYNLKDNAALAEEAIKSVGDNAKIIFVGTDEDVDAAAKFNKNAKRIAVDAKDLSYTYQVMTALGQVDTEFFTVIEQDDTVDSRWYDLIDEYLKKDADEIFAYLPLTEVVDYKTKEVIGYANEAFWASSFSEEVGYLDLGALEDYLNFNVSGGVFRTKDFLSLGGLKTSMKLVFWYEFLMRALYKKKRIFVVPRIGYFHKVNVPNSITDEYTKNMSQKEADWWIELAKKEYYFPQDRNKKYEEE